jgi:hypothetical protein
MFSSQSVELGRLCKRGTYVPLSWYLAGITEMPTSFLPVNSVVLVHI